MIEEYIIRQDDDDEYNPPSYIWLDNHGVLVRCIDCKHYYNEYCRKFGDDYGTEFYCGFAERKADGY